MGLLNRKIPVYMYEKSNLVRLVLFTALLLLYLLIYINLSVLLTGIPFPNSNFFSFRV